jgi:hypothetical protein
MADLGKIALCGEIKKDEYLYMYREIFEILTSHENSENCKKILVPKTITDSIKKGDINTYADWFSQQSGFACFPDQTESPSSVLLYPKYKEGLPKHIFNQFQTGKIDRFLPIPLRVFSYDLIVPDDFFIRLQPTQDTIFKWFAEMPTKHHKMFATELLELFPINKESSSTISFNLSNISNITDLSAMCFTLLKSESYVAKKQELEENKQNIIVGAIKWIKMVLDDKIPKIADIQCYPVCSIQ